MRLFCRKVPFFLIWDEQRRKEKEQNDALLFSLKKESSSNVQLYGLTYSLISEGDTE